jgi:hypothetical protein
MFCPPGAIDVCPFKLPADRSSAKWDDLLGEVGEFDMGGEGYGRSRLLADSDQCEDLTRVKSGLRCRQLDGFGRAVLDEVASIYIAAW